MLKITQTRAVNHAVTLRMEGRLIGPWVSEARDTCERLLAADLAVRLDLADVTFVDSFGAALLVNLRKRCVRLADCSPFVEEQLKMVDESA